MSSATYFHDTSTQTHARDAAANTAFPDSAKGHKIDWPQPKHTPVTISGNTEPAHDTSWMDRGNCLGRTNEMFPEGTGDTFKRRLANAVAICAGCPVFYQCAAYAKATEPSDGVWAGKYRKRQTRQKYDRQPMVRGTTTGYRKHLRYPGTYGDTCAECRKAWSARNNAKGGVA
jgi:hypothetical protein